MDDTKIQQAIVFVGGCADGQRRALTDSTLKRGWIEVVNMQGIMEHGRVMPSSESYRLNRFIDKDGFEYIVAVHSGEQQPFRRLLECYKPADSSDREG